MCTNCNNKGFNVEPHTGEILPCDCEDGANFVLKNWYVPLTLVLCIVCLIFFVTQFLTSVSTLYAGLISVFTVFTYALGVRYYNMIK
jgi:hypothetical protein